MKTAARPKLVRESARLQEAGVCESESVAVAHPVHAAAADDGASKLPVARWGYRHVALFVASLSMFALFWNLGGYRTLNTHEAFAAVPAGEMQRTGDWIVPRFGDEPRLQKPPLMYWLIATSNAVCGVANEWSARLPSALAALGTAGLVGLWATGWYGRTAGLAALLVQATCMGSLYYGRLATVDMTLCLLTTGCLYLIATQPEDEPKRRSRLRWFGVYALLAVSWMGKFFFASLLVVAPVLAYWAVEKRLGKVWRFFNLPGLLVMLAAASLWPYLLYLRVPEAVQVWRDDILSKGQASTADAAGEWWFYVPHLLYLGMPWSLLLLGSARECFRRAWHEGDCRERFLWVCCVAQVLVLTLVPSRHGNYILPAVPLLSLAAGRALGELVEQMRAGRPVVTARQAWGVAAFAIPLSAVGLWLIGIRYPEQRIVVQATGACAVGAAVTALLFGARRRYLFSCVLVTLAAIGAYVSATTSIVPKLDHRASAARFAEEVSQHVPASSPLYVFRLNQVENGMDPVVFYLQRPVRSAEDPPEFTQEFDDYDEVFVVTYSTHAALLSEHGHATTLRQMRDLPGFAPCRHTPFILLQLSRDGPHPAERTSRPGTGVTVTRGAEVMPCNLCGHEEFETISRRDRRGRLLETVLCLQCGLVSHAQIPDEAELAEYYGQEYRVDYHGEVTPSAHRVYRAWRNGGRILRQLQPYLAPTGRVLEVGAGIGCTVKQFELAGYDARGIEPNQGFLAYSREALQARVEIGEWADLPPSPAFDVLLLVHVIEHLRDPAQALSHLRSLLEHRGLLYVECPNFAAPHAAPGKQFHYAHIFNFSPPQLQAMAENCGFELVRHFGGPSNPNLQMLFRRAENRRLAIDPAGVAQVRRALAYNWWTYSLRPGYLAGRVRKLCTYAWERMVGERKVRDIIAKCSAPTPPSPCTETPLIGPGPHALPEPAGPLISRAAVADVKT